MAQLTKDFIEEAKKAYKNKARVEIDGDKLVIRNISTKALHPFKDGRMFIPVADSQKVQISGWLT